uniref:Uncharacterized protein n=1 Tax=Cacopsylla melanoneura TaxID=428564 RepID=A0A8D8S9P7_9HEMI
MSSPPEIWVSFNNSLNWADEVTKIRKKVFGSLWTLKRIKTFTSQNSKKFLMKIFVLPKFEYCAPLLHGMTHEQRAKLQRAQNSCVRFIYNVKRWEHITPYYNRVRWLKIEERRQILTLSLLYKILVSQSPSYLYEKYRFRTDVSSRSTRSHQLLLEKPRHQSHSYSTAFLITSINLWNSEHFLLLQNFTP